MKGLTADIGYISLNKYGEQLCGDRVEIAEHDSVTTLVLADGLGSGVKANILATLTAKIIATMISNGMSIEECVKTIASTLPVCSQRQIAYSTFTILNICRNTQRVDMIQFDNPMVIMLREGVLCEYDTKVQVTEGKKIYTSTLYAQPGDLFVAMSDGAVYAGVGKTLNYGWQRSNIIEYLELRYLPESSAKMAAMIIAEECDRLYQQAPGDDTTIAAIKLRERQTVNLIIGPPSNPADTDSMMAQFFAHDGKRIVCGGTTSGLASSYLGKPVITSLDYWDPSIPPAGKMEGVDLVTEGVITISRVLEHAKSYLGGGDLSTKWNNARDAASLISQMLFETATDINFYVGRAINPAHQNPNLPINFAIKTKLIDELTECLGKMGKKIQVRYF